MEVKVKIEDAEKQKRKESNRLSAKRMRTRNKEKLLDLEKENRELKEEVERLRGVNRKLWSRRVIRPDESTESFDDMEQSDVINKVRDTEKEMKALGIFINDFHQTVDNK